jgi:hypothetical protein
MLRKFEVCGHDFLGDILIIDYFHSRHVSPQQRDSSPKTGHFSPAFAFFSLKITNELIISLILPIKYTPITL